jgi:hypothetical protein
MDSIKEQFRQYDEFISKYDLYIWDFDLTILKIHSYANEIKEEDVKSLSWKKLMCHFADPIFFRDLVNHLIGNKKKVAIISFGYYNVIKAYLDRLFDNDKIFGKHNIITPIDECQRHTSINSDKNQYIINIAREHNVSYTRILFLDDTYLNVNNARELGVSTVKISGKVGFNQSIWNEMVASLTTNDAENNKNNKEQNKENNKEKNKETNIVFNPFDEKNQKKNIPAVSVSGDIIEGYSSNANSDNLLTSVWNIKISDRFMNLINIFAVIFIIIYFYLYYFKKS